MTLYYKFINIPSLGVVLNCRSLGGPSSIISWRWLREKRMNLTYPLPIVKGEAHEPDVTLSVLELMQDRHSWVSQLEGVVQVCKTARLPAHNTVLTWLQTQVYTVCKTARLPAHNTVLTWLQTQVCTVCKTARLPGHNTVLTWLQKQVCTVCKTARLPAHNTVLTWLQTQVYTVCKTASTQYGSQMTTNTSMHCL